VREGTDTISRGFIKTSVGDRLDGSGWARRDILRDFHQAME
jgi:hypothetical protein